MATPNIKALLKNVVAYKASDLHLVSRSEPQIRIDGKLVPLDMEQLNGTAIEEMCYTLITDKQKKKLEEEKSSILLLCSLILVAFVPITITR